MNQFSPVEGVVTSVAPMQTTTNDTSTCTLMLTVLGSNDETFNVVLAFNTFVLDQEPIQRGDIIIAFCDTMAPMPPIYPPQCRAIALMKTRVGQSAMLDFFDRNLLNSDGTLWLNRSGSTDIRLQNGRRFLGTLGNQLLFMVYDATTRSIPAQTTPSRIVVFCSVE